MRQIAVLLTCHNRKAKTLSCLQSLFAQQCQNVSLTVWLVDDGSQDGTAAAVQQHFPAVQLLEGNGRLFWNGGMRKCWLAAMVSPADFYLWLNDDVTLLPDAVQRLVDCYDRHHPGQTGAAPEQVGHFCVGAVVGTMQDPQQHIFSYGGRRAASRWLPLNIGPVVTPGDTAQLCDYVNGNLCLIPAQAAQTIGILSDRFTHSMGDFDYSIRLRRAGFALLIAPGLFGACALNPLKGSIKDVSVPMAERVRWMTLPTKCPPLPEWLYFIRQYGGLFWPLLYIKAVVGRWFPRLWLWFNQRKA